MVHTCSTHMDAVPVAYPKVNAEGGSVRYAIGREAWGMYNVVMGMTIEEVVPSKKDPFIHAGRFFIMQSLGVA